MLKRVSSLPERYRVYIHKRRTLQLEMTSHVQILETLQVAWIAEHGITRHKLSTCQSLLFFDCGHDEMSIRGRENADGAFAKPMLDEAQG